MALQTKYCGILEMFTYRITFYPNFMRYGLYTIFINHVISPLLSWLRERHISVMVLAAKQCFSYVHPNVWFKILFLDNQFCSCFTKLFQNEYKFSTRFCWNKEKLEMLQKKVLTYWKDSQIQKEVLLLHKTKKSVSFLHVCHKSHKSFLAPVNKHKNT